MIWNDFADFTAPPYAAGGFIIHLYLVLVFCSVYFGCDVRLCFMITIETVSRKQSNQRLVLDQQPMEMIILFMQF